MLNAKDVMQKIFFATDGNTRNPVATCNQAISNTPLLLKKSYHINDLLIYENSEFIINSYFAILKRYPEANGLNYYLYKLQQNSISKPGFLIRLRYSPEGRYTGVKIKMLLIYFLVSAIKRILNITI